MSDRQRVTIDPAFSLSLPEGWAAEADEEEGVSVYAAEGAGLLHLVAFPHAADEELDPAEELYAFLEEQGIEIEEDEVEDLELPAGGGLALCEYLSEEDEGGEEEETTYWLVGVAIGPGTLLFVSYSCPSGEEEQERASVRAILESISFPGQRAA
jgi:hypothetical protein